MRGLHLFLAMCGLVYCAGTALAQTGAQVPPKSVVAPDSSVDITEVQSRRNALFAVMISQPDNLDIAFEYAALSVQAGDLEAAVSTLERMLIFAPGLPRLQLELGVLYYRLSAFETARSYFESAISGPDVPDEVREKVGQYLTGVDKAGETTRFAGQVRAGIRYQSNANRAPLDGTILLNGLPFTLTQGATGSPDGNVYGAGIFHYSINLPSQGDTIEADLVTYGSKQFERSELDVALAELSVGPAFNLGRVGIENGALGVYGIASGVFIDGHFYSAAGGAGARLVLRPAPGFSTVTGVEYRYRDFDNSAAAPTADQRDGHEVRGFASATYVINPRVAIGGTAQAQRTTADRGFLAYSEGGLSANVSVSFNSPFGANSAPWIFSPNAGFVYRKYDDPDPLINAAFAEDDLEAFVGANLTVPIKDGWAVLTETEYRNVDSNYSTRKYDNFSVSLSVVKSF